MEHSVRIHRNGGTENLRAAAGVNLLDFLREHSLQPDSPCGGNGSCGKCRVKVEGLLKEPSEKEKLLLGRHALAEGMRLACYNMVQGDIDIYIEDREAAASIVTGGRSRNIRLVPAVGKEYVELDEPALDDQGSDIERVLAYTGGALDASCLKLLRRLPGLLRTSGFRATLVSVEGRLAAVEEGNTSESLFGAAFDIGTTTIAAYLYDLGKGVLKDVISMLNPQARYGADVLSRIEHSLKAGGGETMHRTIVDCINRILGQFVQRNGLGAEEIYSAVFAGNTTMMHFLMDLYAGNIAVSPFIPATTLAHRMKAEELGLAMNSCGQVTVLPGVSAYIGADTVAAVLSSGMYEDERICLLVDIGTNGEIVLGCRDWLISCSTAAGPAFEGANIHNGVGGISGAIDTVRLLPEFCVTTLDSRAPIGICGSGIVDAVSQMLEAGLLDETGRLVDEDEMTEAAARYADRVVRAEGVKAFRLTAGPEGNDEGGIIVTQRDVREIQNAKAAIAAGIKTLAGKAGINIGDIQQVYLAGGFGSRINIESAVRIGLLPGELAGRIESIGNAAGAGAVECLLSMEMLEAANRIKTRMKYVELSGLAEFTEEYVESMLF